MNLEYDADQIKTRIFEFRKKKHFDDFSMISSFAVQKNPVIFLEWQFLRTSWHLVHI